MATTQPRQPAGTPTGGQFSVTSRSEPLSELGPDGSRRIEAFGGRVEFVDAQGDLHREDGPAVEDQRYLEWWTHGVNTRNIDRATGQDLGGTPAHEPQDHGFMYDWSFYDLDGHGWGVFWMDPAAVQG